MNGKTFFAGDETRYVTPVTGQVFLRWMILGAMGGFLTWLLAWGLDALLLSPLLCVSGSTYCAGVQACASNIALILVAIILVPLAVLAGVRRPVLVLLATVSALVGAIVPHPDAWLISLLLSTLGFTGVLLASAWIGRIRGFGAAFLFLSLFVILARVVVML